MKHQKAAAGLLCAVFLAVWLTGCAPQAEGGGPKPGNPTAITIWHYYNGDQKKSFDRLVQEFNESVGAEQGIVVEAHGYGGVSELNDKVLDAVYEKVGAEEIPDIFASYADTAYEINGLGKVADLSQYLTEEEQSRYISGYLEEGRFEEEGGYKIFPVAKSTELLTLNKTEWDRFVEATGADEGDLATWEGIAALSEQYYRWTDSLTPDISEDGKAFFGRDAFANYIIIGSKQLGTELFQVTDGKVTLQVNEAVMRRLWDNYYVPFINGYFGAYGKFRSDDLRTGVLACYVGATSGAPFFQPEVTREDGSTYPIEGAVYPLPNFEDTKPMAVQQGAGMVVVKSSQTQERAAVTFLKWLTEPKQNAQFSVASGYLPVTYEGNDQTKLAENAGGAAMSEVLRETLETGMEMTGSYDFYTSKAFENGSAARGVVESSMKTKAMEDRAAVLALMTDGMSRADAVAQYNTAENFQLWLDGFRTELEQIAKG